MAKTPDPTVIVVDADVLAGDLFIDGDARRVMDRIRENRWLTLVASEPLIDDGRAIIARLGDEQLATAWVHRIRQRCTLVEHPAGDHPALASAYAGRAAHIITYDERLLTARAGLAMRRAMPVSIRTPDAFLTTVDLDALNEMHPEDTHVDPDRDPSV